MSEQLKDSETILEEKPKIKRNVTFNMVHILVMQGILKTLYESIPDEKNEQYKNLLVDIIYILEYTIDESPDEELKEKIKYQPLKIQDDETK